MSAGDDDRTTLVPVTRDGAGPALTAMPGAGNALPVGTRLAEFEVTGVLGAGGFGIVYLAYDARLERHVALKEFMPAGFALRDADGRVHPCNEEAFEAFAIGLHSFVNEARLLARFDAPSLLKVYRFWEENGTAYMVMPYYRGHTLKQAAADSNPFADEEALRRLLDSLLDALAILHAEQCYHRDIAPDNILVLDDGRPVLLDFGAARRAIGDMPQAFTTIFKQAYAPVEQISDGGEQRQGPWTDLFALAGVIHFVIDGQPPPPAVGRMLADAYVPLAQRYAGRYSASLLGAIDRALALRPQDRPQSVQQMRELLGQAPGPAAAPVAAPAAVEPAVDAAAAAAAAGPEKPAGAPRRWPLAAGAVLGLALAAGLAFHFLTPRNEAAPARAAQAAQAAPPFDPRSEFERVVAGATRGFGVQVTVSKPQVVINRDRYGFTIHAEHAGYVYVEMLASDDANPLLVFPNADDRDNRIEAGQTLSVPRSGWRLEAAGPPGTDRFVAIVSEAPRDFAAAGFVDGQPFSQFSPARLRAAPLPPSAVSPMAGVVQCRAAGPCSQRYGAAGFTIEEVAR